MALIAGADVGNGSTDERKGESDRSVIAVGDGRAEIGNVTASRETGAVEGE